MIDLESVTRLGRCWSRGNSTDMGDDRCVGGTNDTKRPIGKAAVMRAFAASRTRRVGTGSRGRATRANDVGGKTKMSLALVTVGGWAGMGERDWGFQIKSRVVAPTVDPELYLRSLRLSSAFASRSVSIS